MMRKSQPSPTRDPARVGIGAVSSHSPRCCSGTMEHRGMTPQGVRMYRLVMAPSPLDPTLNANTSGSTEHPSGHSDTHRADGRGESSLGSLWLANSQSCRQGARTNSRAVTRVGTAEGPNPCCAFHVGSTTDGAHSTARSVDTHRDLCSCLGACDVHTPSRRHRRLIEPSTVRLPAIRTDTRPHNTRRRARVRRTPLQPRMSAMTIVVTLELKKL